MQEITLEVILKTVFGLTGESRIKGIVTEFLRLSMKPEVTILSILTSGDRLRRFLGQKYAPIVEQVAKWGGPMAKLPWAELARAARELDDALLGEIADRRKVAAGRTDIMSLLIGAVDEEGEGLSDGELRDEMMTLLVAGHETTAITLAWAIGLCVGHPEVMAEMRLEYDQVFGRARDGRRGGGVRPGAHPRAQIHRCGRARDPALVPRSVGRGASTQAADDHRRVRAPRRGLGFPLRVPLASRSPNLAPPAALRSFALRRIEGPSRASGSPSAGGRARASGWPSRSTR